MMPFVYPFEFERNLNLRHRLFVRLQGKMRYGGMEGRGEAEKWLVCQTRDIKQTHLLSCTTHKGDCLTCLSASVPAIDMGGRWVGRQAVRGSDEVGYIRRCIHVVTAPRKAISDTQHLNSSFNERWNSQSNRTCIAT